jgi:mono/diheme cytochrome c family protein
MRRAAALVFNQAKQSYVRRSLRRALSPYQRENMFRIIATCALLLMSGASGAQDEIKQGAETYARHCAACHGVRMRNPEGAFDLLTFPADGRERFINSVTRGKSTMPPFGGLLPPEEITALWAYVASGDKN